MADTKITELTAITSLSSDDVLYVVDSPGGTPADRKVTFGNLEASIAIANISGTLAVNKGGTGQTTANGALNALLPSQTGNSGKVLQTDGSSTSWATVSGGGGGYATVADEGISLTQRTTLNFTGAGIAATDNSGSSRTDVSLDATLNTLAAYNTNGLITQTAADTFTGRTITGTSNEISVSNGDGVSGNPTLSLPATVDMSGKTVLVTANTTPTMATNGHLAVDTSVTDFAQGVLKYYGGAEMGVVAMPIAQFTTPSNGRVVAYNATNDGFELVANGGQTITTGYKTADQATTSATGVDVTSLVFAIGASEVWSAEFTLGMTVSGAAGAKFSVTVPSGATMSAMVRGTNAAPGVITTSGTLTSALLTTTNSACHISVLVQNSTTAGNVQCQIASGDGVVTATAKGGQCYFTARKLA